MTLEYEQLILTGNNENILESKHKFHVSHFVILWKPHTNCASTVVWQLPNDPNYRETDNDRYVVFHFHFEHLQNHGGLMLPGIYAVVAFHAQRYNTGHYPRIDGRDHGDNRRAHIMNCNTGSDANENTLYWYPGDLPNSAVTGLPAWAQIMTRFGNYLFSQDLVTEQTFVGPTRGQLTTISEPNCPSRLYFNWGGYRQSRQFTPNSDQGQPGTDPNPNEDDGV